MAPFHVNDDYYRILGVSQIASHEVIKESYKKLALQLHPDRNNLPHATASFQLLGQAWETLKDKDKRAAYDHDHRLQQQKSAKLDCKRNTNSSTAPGKRKHRHRRRERYKPTGSPPESYQKREETPRVSQPAHRERDPANLPQILLWDDSEHILHETRPFIDHITLMELFKRRIEDMEDELEELDRLDDGDEEEIEGMSLWGLSWQENWRVAHLENQFEVRQTQRRELIHEVIATWGKIQRLEEESSMGDTWF